MQLFLELGVNFSLKGDGKLFRRSIHFMRSVADFYYSDLIALYDFFKSFSFPVRPAPVTMKKPVILNSTCGNVSWTSKKHYSKFKVSGNATNVNDA